MSVFLGVISQKGGVGKTSIATNLGYAFCQKGWRVLLVDCDPQGGLGSSLSEKAKNYPGLFDVLLNPGWENSMAQFPIWTCMNQMEFLPRGTGDLTDLAMMEPGGSWSSRDRVRPVMSAIRGLGHDIVIFDTPPGIGSLSVHISAGMDHLLIPATPGPLNNRSLPQMLRMLNCLQLQADVSETPEVAGFVISMLDWGNHSTPAEEQDFRNLLPPELVLQTAIPFHPDMVEASRIGVPVGMLNQNGNGPGSLFTQLATELEPKIGLANKHFSPYRTGSGG